MEKFKKEAKKSAEESKDLSKGAITRNDTAGYGDDTIGENTEMTPLAKEILKEEAAASAKEK